EHVICPSQFVECLVIKIVESKRQNFLIFRNRFVKFLSFEIIFTNSQMHFRCERISRKFGCQLFERSNRRFILSIFDQCISKEVKRRIFVLKRREVFLDSFERRNCKRKSLMLKKFALFPFRKFSQVLCKFELKLSQAIKSERSSLAT